jgi:hypothetical protein
MLQKTVSIARTCALLGGTRFARSGLHACMGMVLQADLPGLYIPLRTQPTLYLYCTVDLALAGVHYKTACGIQHKILPHPAGIFLRGSI